VRNDGGAAVLEDGYRPDSVGQAKDKFVVLSGCSGGGKSSLLSALAARGYRVFAEPGREVIREQNFIGGDATPEKDVLKFLDLTISRTMRHMISAASTKATVFFDRSIVDQVGGFERMGMEIPTHLQRAVELFRYHRRVFITPPWPEIFRNDAERRHSFEDAVANYETQLKTYERFGYEPVMIPRLSVEERADFVLKTLSPGQAPSSSSSNSVG
jgi:predicted ATPase